MRINRRKTRTLPLLPLRDMVVFPHMIVPLFVGRQRSVSAAAEAYQFGQELILTAQKSADIAEPEPSDLYDVAVAAKIEDFFKIGDGSIKVVVQGLRRVNIKKVVVLDRFYGAETEDLLDNSRCFTEALHLMQSLKDMLTSPGTKKIPQEMLCNLLKIQDPELFADTISSLLSLDTVQKQILLELIDPSARLIQLLDIFESEMKVHKHDENVPGVLNDQDPVSRNEYYLEEQLKTIKKDLGNHDEIESETDELKSRIQKAKLPPHVNRRANRELKRLEQMPPMSAEGSVLRHYLEWLIDTPWESRAKENLSIVDARKILDSEHYGLEKVKERIVEFLAVKNLLREIRGPILCLTGPPGVGKTSLGRSIAKATGRKFARLSLGGVRDEAEIRGHRKTYIGSMPGKIIQLIKKTGTRNPVFMLDEVDKISTDHRGDPASALLEVLDPDHNHSFNDHFLELDFDLSEVLFIATANVTHTISKPLLDRMEIFPVEGYTVDEKIEIAGRYLAKKNITAHGLKNDQVRFSQSTLKEIVEGYTRESGVRTLDRKIATICRKAARFVVENEKLTDSLVFPTSENTVLKLLGPRPYLRPKLEKDGETGLVNGLAWTEAGGEILSIETNVLPGRGELTLTGQMGDVMKESARAALGFVRSEYIKLGLEKKFYTLVDIHIHIPEGAIPKDGPSAGITMATAMVSALTSLPVFQNLAMTGEITLRGKVLQVGGLKEKLLAALRAGVTTVLLPENNKKDIKEIPKKIVKAFTIHFVNSMDDVLKHALQKPLPCSSSCKKSGLFPPGKTPHQVPVN